jgi:GAF domain-containing protein
MITATDAAVRRGEILPGMQSQLVIPLRRGEQTLGVLDIQDIDASPFRDEDIEVLQAIAAQLSIAVENARRFGELQKASDERHRLADELKQASDEIEQLNQEVTERVWTRYLAGRGETVIGYDWRQGTLLPATDNYPGMDRTLNARQPELYVEDDEHVLSVPIISRGQVLGVMEFRAPSSRVWNKRSLELARVISQRLALALDNVRLFEQAQIIATREQLASQIAANLQTKTDVDTLVNVAAESFQQALGASRTNIRLGFPEQQPPQNGRNGSH